MSGRSDCTETLFLKDVATHQMKVLRDEGLNRHVRFRRPESSSYWFDIVTWPGVLCINGDMGTYVFHRIDDMFDFFRMSEHDFNRNPNGLSINPGYWSEKVLAQDRNGKIEEFDKERFRNVIDDYRRGWIRNNRDLLSKNQRRELWEAVDDEVLCYLDDGEHEAFSVAHRFEHKVGEKSFYFQDLWDHRFNDYTFHFIWCCYAIAWAINQYDRSTAKQQAEVIS